jgi:ribosomal-protein-alanine N-acetyltransferase
MARDLSPDVHIRDYRKSDFQRLLEIDCACFDTGIAYTRTELLFYLRQSHGLARIAERHGCIVGFVIARIENQFCGHVITLDVVSEARRCGIGSLLMEVLHDALRRTGAALAVLEVDVQNSSAQAFYEKLGYERVETLRGYYKVGRDAYRMVCFL